MAGKIDGGNQNRWRKGTTEVHLIPDPLWAKVAGFARFSKDFLVILLALLCIRVTPEIKLDGGNLAPSGSPGKPRVSQNINRGRKSGSERISRKTEGASK